MNWFTNILLITILSSYNSLTVTANWTIDLYKKFISPLQGQNICNFSPTCSQFYKQSINKYGIVIGTMMGADRLLRCNPWAWTYLDKYYHSIENDRIFDPPENHHFACATNIANTFLISNDDTLIKPTQPTKTGLDFADYLFQQKDYLRAVGEYQRLLFFYPDTEKNIKEYILLMLGESYFRLANYQQAFKYFNRLQNNFYKNYNFARIYFAQADYKKCRQQINNISKDQLNEKVIILYGLSYYQEYKFQEGARFFREKLTVGNSIMNELSKFDGRNVKYRSRLLSSLFSAIIPGFGQAYCGRWGDGIYSFVTTVSCGLIANYYYNHDESKIKFSIFSALTALFWMGNVYGANISARDYNQFQLTQYLRQINDVIDGFNFIPNYDSLKLHN
ncbi:MAG: membrane protein insertion efficiency factor YidD [candidate division WOR-3 bacterium]